VMKVTVDNQELEGNWELTSGNFVN